jgi:hypothetical protein
MSSKPSGAYVPTSSDEDDYVEISASASISTLEMSQAEKREAAVRKRRRDRMGGFGFARGAHES